MVPSRHVRKGGHAGFSEIVWRFLARSVRIPGYSREPYGRGASFSSIEGVVMNSQRTRSAIILLVPLLGMPMSMSSYAANTDKTPAPSATTAKSSRDMRATQLLGKNVENAKGENLGEIKDLIIDVNNERVFYAVLEFGGFLGMGEKLFAYPVRAFSYTGDNRDKLLLNVDEAKLKAAPGFARDKWPDWSTYGGSVDRYYGETVQLKTMPNQKLRRCSDLIGKDVNDRAGKDIGEIEDIVVDMSSGKIHYAILEFDRSWNLKDKLIALPMRAFSYAGKRDDLVLNVDKSVIDTARAFDKSRWPDVNDRNYMSDIDRYLGTVGAQTPPATAEARFLRLDANGDGMVSKDEADADASVKQVWTKLDRDNDGKVSRKDFLAHHWRQ
jgi:sporulation protein YlmC with PRC-barrel domain